MGYTELFLRFPDYKTRAVTLSYDDGKSEDRKMVEILNKYGVKCTFNLNAGKIEGDDNRVQFEEFAALYEGHEIACHTLTHPHLNNLDVGGIAYQIVKDRELLEEKTGKIIRGFAYPFGLAERPGMVDCIGSCGIRYGRTTVSTYGFDLPVDYLRWHATCHQADPKLPELAKEFFKPDDLEHPWRIRPQLFYIWGHSYEYAGCWEKLEEMCALVGGKENVWYATNMEIVDYVSAFRSLQRSVNGKIIHNPTNVDVFVVADNKNIFIAKGATVTIE
ncbi:MAG: polysaccharide deacetylase family protein [Clostridia bacterium]|nr:polysaccharide deacetylase family protein [Clostridia bacterium]